jgi:hypothetical protein
MGGDAQLLVATEIAHGVVCQVLRLWTVDWPEAAEGEPL